MEVCVQDLLLSDKSKRGPNKICYVLQRWLPPLREPDGACDRRSHTSKQVRGLSRQYHQADHSHSRRHQGLPDSPIREAQVSRIRDTESKAETQKGRPATFHRDVPGLRGTLSYGYSNQGNREKTFRWWSASEEALNARINAHSVKSLPQKLLYHNGITCVGSIMIISLDGCN